MLFLLPFLFSCSSSKERKNTLSGQLVGEWRNVYMKVEMYTYNNTDSLKTMEVTEANWEKILNIKTIRTLYKENGSYNSEHKNLQDSIIYNPAGKWSIVGDTLIMTDTFPKKGLNYKYKLEIKENNGVNKEIIAEFFGVEDFDQDGKIDDKYYGIQRKQQSNY